MHLLTEWETRLMHHDGHLFYMNIQLEDIADTNRETEDISIIVRFYLCFVCFFVFVFLKKNGVTVAQGIIFKIA